ncbi:MAG: NADH-quinone oxidoreductase subunit C [Actinomycetes bacterium]
MSPLEPAPVTVIDVPPDQWLTGLQHQFDSGRTYFDFLAATDRGDDVLEVVVHVMTPQASDRTLVRTAVPAGVPLPSLVDVFPAAAWHEREAHEFLGLSFSGHPDLRPLLLAEGSRPPLRRSWALRARLDRRWPGASEPDARSTTEIASGRTRTRPTPGNRDDWPTPEPAVGACDA